MNKKKRYKLILSIIMVFSFMLSNFKIAFGANTASTPGYMYTGKTLSVPFPTGYDTSMLTYIGVLVERYQPTTANSNTDTDYTDIVSIDGVTQYFIPVAQGNDTDSDGNADVFDFKFDNTATRTALFSAFYDTALLGGKTHNLNTVPGNSKFRMKVYHLFRLPDNTDIVGGEKELFIQLAPAITKVYASTGDGATTNKDGTPKEITIKVDFSQPVVVPSNANLPVILDGGVKYNLTLTDADNPNMHNSAVGISTLTFRYTPLATHNAIILDTDTMVSVGGNIHAIDSQGGTNVNAWLGMPMQNSLKYNNEVCIDNVSTEPTITLNTLNDAAFTVGLGGKKYTKGVISPSVTYKDNYSGLKSFNFSILNNTMTSVYNSTVKLLAKKTVLTNNASKSLVIGTGLSELGINTYTYTLVNHNTGTNANLVDYEGEVYVKYTVNDSVGYVKDTGTTIQYNVDRKAPTVTNQTVGGIVQAVMTDNGSGTATFNYYATDVDVFTAYNRTIAVNAVNAVETRDLVTAPTNKFIFYEVIDRLGNTRTGKLILDAVAPRAPKITLTPNVAQTAPRTFVNTNVKVDIYHGPDVDGPVGGNSGTVKTMISLNSGSTWTTYNTATPITTVIDTLANTSTKSASATYIIWAKSVDMSGNESTITKVDFGIDKIVPTITVNPNGLPDGVSNLDIDVSANDGTGSGVDTLEYKFQEHVTSPVDSYVDLSAYKPVTGGKATFFGYKDMEVRLVVKVTDKAGNTNASTPWTSNPYYIDGSGPLLKRIFDDKTGLNIIASNKTIEYGESIKNLIKESTGDYAVAFLVKDTYSNINSGVYENNLMLNKIGVALDKVALFNYDSVSGQNYLKTLPNGIYYEKYTDDKTYLCVIKNKSGKSGNITVMLASEDVPGNRSVNSFIVKLLNGNNTTILSKLNNTGIRIKDTVANEEYLFSVTDNKTNAVSYDYDYYFSSYVNVVVNEHIGISDTIAKFHPAKTLLGDDLGHTKGTTTFDYTNSLSKGLIAQKISFDLFDSVDTSVENKVETITDVMKVIKNPIDSLFDIKLNALQTQLTLKYLPIDAQLTTLANNVLTYGSLDLKKVNYMLGDTFNQTVFDSQVLDLTAQKTLNRTNEKILYIGYKDLNYVKQIPLTEDMFNIAFSNIPDTILKVALDYSAEAKLVNASTLYAVPYDYTNITDDGNVVSYCSVPSDSNNALLNRYLSKTETDKAIYTDLVTASGSEQTLVDNTNFIKVNKSGSYLVGVKATSKYGVVTYDVRELKVLLDADSKTLININENSDYLFNNKIMLNLMTNKLISVNSADNRPQIRKEGLISSNNFIIVYSTIADANLVRIYDSNLKQIGLIQNTTTSGVNNIIEYNNKLLITFKNYTDKIYSIDLSALSDTGINNNAVITVNDLVVDSDLATYANAYSIGVSGMYLVIGSTGDDAIRILDDSYSLMKTISATDLFSFPTSKVTNIYAKDGLIYLYTDDELEAYVLRLTY